jgi:succinylglutamic semialdehyde dehydrogenase
VAEDLQDAIVQANATDFGLAASIFTRSEASVAAAMTGLRAGCINVNCGTAGASGKLPFGGLGRSGNLRPAGAAMIDACAYPVATMAERGSAATVAPGMTVPDAV